VNHGKVISEYIGAFVDELVRCGVNQVVINPGSRSTPLALLMAEHPEMKVWTHIDERSAAFFAMGIAKAQKKAVALVCSSGTAVANYMPAVVEAFQSRVPLLVLTADRPHELREVGAPQAIDQIGIFGKFVKLFIEMSAPDRSPELQKYVRIAAARASAVALCGPSGPVHLNFPFREPLLPELTIPAIWEGGRKQGACYTQVLTGNRILEKGQVATLAGQLKKIERGLIICGPHDDPLFADAAVSLAKRLQYPLLADPLSQVRSGSHDKEWVIDTYDSFLRDSTVQDQLDPEVVIRFGAMPVSKAVLLYLKKNPACRQIIVDEDPGWRDPTLMAADMIYASAVPFCQDLSNLLASASDHCPSVLSGWAQKWLKANEVAKKELYMQGKNDALSEGQVFLELCENLPRDATLFAGNSMPIRDLDTFFFCNDRNIRIMANRGANGIDGVVSTALGVSAAQTPLVLVIGDLSFYHDLNGLLAAKLHRLNATIILINNDGGGIFSFLPQAKLPRHFETLFGTPLGLDFKPVVEMYQGKFTRVVSWNDFGEALQQGLTANGLHVIEICTKREENVRMHREVWDAVSRSVCAAFASF